MTGLDLESFLLLLRADLSVWLLLGLSTAGLGLLVWASWSSRRALRNCLVLSLSAHLAFVVFGSAFPGIVWRLTPNRRQPHERSHIREIRVAALVEPDGSRRSDSMVSSGSVDAKLKGDEKAKSQAPRWDLLDVPLPIADPQLRVGRPSELDQRTPELQPKLAENVPPAAAVATPKGTQLAPSAHVPEAPPAGRLEIECRSPRDPGARSFNHRRDR